MDEELKTDESVQGEALDSTADSDSKQGKPKKKGKAKLILLIIVIVFVLLFGGVGVVYATQHENPQFCNVICHTPMDPYVTSYMDGTSVNPQQVDSGVVLDVTVHRDSDQDIVCLTCHTDGIDRQINEGIAWVSGNYTQPLNPLQLTVKDPKDVHERSGIETCLTAGCHEGISSLEELQASTADLKRNVHDSHAGALDCTTCHQMHEQSVVYCTQCHVDAEVPEGWLTYSESQQQK